VEPIADALALEPVAVALLAEAMADRPVAVELSPVADDKTPVAVAPLPVATLFEPSALLFGPLANASSPKAVENAAEAVENDPTAVLARPEDAAAAPTAVPNPPFDVAPAPTAVSLLPAPVVEPVPHSVELAAGPLLHSGVASAQAGLASPAIMAAAEIDIALIMKLLVMVSLPMLHHAAAHAGDIRTAPPHITANSGATPFAVFRLVFATRGNGAYVSWLPKHYRKKSSCNTGAGVFLQHAAIAHKQPPCPL
jgi:hypothetical protein